MAQTPDDVYQFVLSQLSGGTVDVELAFADFGYKLAEAVGKMNIARPQQAEQAIAVTSQVKRYEITHPGLLGVLKMNFVPDPSYLDDGEKDQFVRYGDPILHQPVTASGMFLDAASNENMQRILSRECEYSAKWERCSSVPYKRYVVYIDIPEAFVGNVSYTYTWAITPDKDPMTGMDFLSVSEYDWIKDYTLAGCRILVGQARSKLGNITGPDGNGIETDGTAQIDRGNSDTATLLEKLKRMRRATLVLSE